MINWWFYQKNYCEKIESQKNVKFFRGFVIRLIIMFHDLYIVRHIFFTIFIL